MTDKKSKKEEDFFFVSFADRDEGKGEVGGLSDAPSILKGLRGPLEKWNDLGDPPKEAVRGDVGQVEMLAADDSLFIVTVGRSLIKIFDGRLR